jgi:hypothetical protein
MLLSTPTKKRINATRRQILIFSVLAIVSMSPMSAQLSTGSIVGAVEDPTGAALPGVQITAIKTETGASRRVTTSAHGDFVLNSMEPGTYTVTFSLSGFNTIQLENVILTTGEILPMPHVGLTVGAVSQTTTVSAEGATIMLGSSERSDLLSSSQIDNLLVRGRTFTDLISLAPGVLNTSKSNDISTTSASTLYVNGNRSNSNAIYIDGIPSNAMSATNLVNQVSQDAVSEVKMETSNYEAEYGRQAGSNIIAVTKSGTTDFHGLVSYFNRNEDYNANNYFNKLNGIARPQYRYNTLNYDIGGPVFIPGHFNRGKDKLFFFWLQEFWPTHATQTGSVTVPTALERQGNFSQSVTTAGTVTITNPYNNQAPFRENIIPTSQLDADGIALLNIFPLPNFTNTAISKGNYNYVFSTPESTPLSTSTLRIDYHPNQRDTISGSYNAFYETIGGALGLPDQGANWPLMSKNYYTDFKGFSGRWLHIFNPSLLNELQGGYVYQTAGDTYTNEQLKKIVRSAVGFNVSQFYPLANPLNILPNTTFGGISSAANTNSEGRFPLYNRYRLFSGTDTISYTRGTHNAKAGFYGEYYRRIQKTQAGGAFNGAFDFTSNAKNPLNTGDAYANLAIGTFNGYTERSIPGVFNLQDEDFEGYIQDNWKITKKLTLDYGMRYYYVTPFTEVNNQVSAFVPSQYNPADAVRLIAPALVGGVRVGIDPGTGKQYPAADIGALSPSIGNPSNGMVAAYARGSLPRSLTPGAGLQIGPRLGFAYDVFGNGKTAIRGGAGIFQERTQENYFDDFVGLPPIAQTPQVTYGQLSTFLSSTGLLFPNNVYGIAPKGHMAEVTNYSLSVQQDLGFSTILDIAYVGSQGRHLQWFVDQNSIPLGADFLSSNHDSTQSAGTPLPASFYRPTIGYNSIYQLNNGSSSSYNALQVSAQRRFAKHLQFGLAYTWSKAMDYNDTDLDVITPAVPVRAYYHSLATFDRPQILEINFVYDLPKIPWKNAVAQGIVSNWQVSDISSFQSGAPLGVSITTNTGEDITGSVSVAPRAVVTGNPNLLRGDRSFSHYFNTSVIQLPNVGTYGNAPRLFIRGPGINDFDLALLKNIPVYERFHLQIRCEAYNAFNHTQFSAINTSPTFNATTKAQTNAQFGQVTAARDPRQLQLAARFTF